MNFSKTQKKIAQITASAVMAFSILIAPVAQVEAYDSYEYSNYSDSYEYSNYEPSGYYDSYEYSNYTDSYNYSDYSDSYEYSNYEPSGYYDSYEYSNYSDLNSDIYSDDVLLYDIQNELVYDDTCYGCDGYYGYSDTCYNCYGYGSYSWPYYGYGYGGYYGGYSYSIGYCSLFGCDNGDNITIINNNGGGNNYNLNAYCSVSDTTVDEDDRVTFTANVSGGKGPYTYSWGGDVDGNDRSESVRFSREGTYDAHVTITDSDGDTVVANCAEVDVDDDNDNDRDDDLDVVCRVSDTYINEGGSVTFTADVDGGNSPYDYDWRGDISGDDRRETVRFNRDGYYDVRITVRDDDGNRASDTCATVRVGDFGGSLAYYGNDYYSGTGSNVYSSAPSGNLAAVNSVFLDQVPTTGADSTQIILYTISLILWSIAVAYYLNKRKIKKLNSDKIAEFKKRNLASRLA